MTKLPSGVRLYMQGFASRNVAALPGIHDSMASTIGSTVAGHVYVAIELVGGSLVGPRQWKAALTPSPKSGKPYSGLVILPDQGRNGGETVGIVIESSRRKPGLHISLHAHGHAERLERFLEPWALTTG